jgi:hypothetical protein
MKTSSLAPRVRAIAAIALLAGATAAQRRAPLLGVVRDAGGAPVAGANVTVVEDDPDLAGVDPVDVVEATTDARGRFKVDALCGVRYAAFAVGPERDGRAAVARPVLGLACARAAELVLSIDAQRRTVRVPELAVFGARDTLRVRLPLPHAGGHALELPFADDGALPLPPLAALGNLELRDRDGRFVADLFVPLAPGQGVSVPEPLTVSVVVVGERGKPVQGARVAAHRGARADGGAWTVSRRVARDGPFAVTDAEGRAAVRCLTWREPIADAPDDLVVTASTPDGRYGVSGWASQEPFVDWQLGERHGRDTVRIPLRTDTVKSGVAAGTGVVGRKARAFVLGRARGTRDGAMLSYFVPCAHDVAIADDGAFAVPVAAADTGDVTLVTPRVEGKRVVWLPGRDGALPQLDLATCEPLSVRVVDATGGPAIAAELLLVPADCTAHDIDHAPSLVPDPAGRVEVLLQRGSWTLLAADATHWAALELTEWTAASPLTLTLEPKPSMRVRVVDAAGAPGAGARFEPEWFPGAPLIGRRSGLDAALRELGWNHFAANVRAATTDANGHATLHWLPLRLPALPLFAFHGDHSRRSDAVPAVADDAGGDPVRIALRQ